ncbi:hypothetical protein ALQ07_102508 [Pseudomonas syringae pv. actinidiae]|uniref:Uncharacterized protein n=1 Tax=Pseudomonas syringae pv. actinidiae TaxID=103796 RepID=A0A3M4KBX8_PSESF|nr:hypothetical protein ALQ07_102508 [Pseudomonas syringae pv. actinidiae]
MHNEKPPALHSGGFSSPDKSAIDSMTIVENRPMYVFRKDADHSGKHFNIIACRVQHCASTRPQRMACALRLPQKPVRLVSARSGTTSFATFHAGHGSGHAGARTLAGSARPRCPAALARPGREASARCRRPPSATGNDA